MSTEKDYLGSTIEEFNTAQEEIMTKTHANLVAYGINPLFFGVVTALQMVWVVVYPAAKNKKTRNSVNIKERNDSLKDYKAGLRNFVNKYLIPNDLVPDADLLAMGIPIPKDGRTKVGIPKTVPVGSVNTSQRLLHTIDFKDETTVKGHAKPDGVIGCEIWRKVGSPVVDESELQFAGMATKIGYKLNYGLKDAKQNIYYWIRWVNTKGEPGGWGPPFSGTVGE